MASSDFILRAQNIRKAFGAVNVLEDVSFHIARGEVHTLMGENGAGKSTLMKIIAGVYSPDAGDVLLDGQAVQLSSPTRALNLGIALIHQEPLSFPDLSIAENIYLSRGTPRGRLGQIDWGTMRRQATNWLASLGVTLDVKRPMHGLSIADQQMVELAAALSQNARVLLMDEPTAALTPREADRLFGIVDKLKSAGTAIVFISHRLEEVFKISDRITVLRDGKLAGSKRKTETSTQEIIRMMVGREVSSLYEKPQAVIGKTLLKVNGLSARGQFADVSFELRAGEILGVAGLVGAGRTDVAQTIFGITPATSGTIEVNGNFVRIRSPKKATKLGIAYVPEDRRQHGLILPMTIASNTSMASLGQVSSLGWIVGRRETTLADEWKTKLRTRCRDVGQAAGDLSGGNQQKVVLSKWLTTDPAILLVDEPTRGIDIGAKMEVHHLLAELARAGKAILMISSDLPEVLSMSDRVLVMREGRVTALLSREEATQERVMAAATGMASAPPLSAGENTKHLPPLPLGEGRGEGASRSMPTDSPIALTPALSRREREQDAPVRGRREVSPLAKFMQFRELGAAAFVLLAFAFVTWREPRFADTDNVRSIMMFLPLLVIVAMGQLLAILSRNIDLSVGSILGLTSMVVVGYLRDHPTTPLALAAVMTLGVGAILGAINGLLIAFCRVPAIIATLGTLTAYRGLVHIYSGGVQIDRNNIPVGLRNLSLEGPLTIPWIVWFAGGIAVAMWAFLRYARMGRAIYALGSSPHAAQLRGIPVRGTKMLIFTLSGALAGFAGLMFAARFGTVNASSVGQSMELQTISAVVIGGAAVNGGAGSVLGTVLGCVMLGVVNTALPMLHVSPFWETAIYGAAIVIAVWISTTLARKSGAEVTA